MAMRMTVRQASQRFSDVIKAVKAGREVVLTDKGKRIAVIKPWALPEQEETILRRLEAAGLLRRATVRRPLPPFRPVRIRGEPITATLRRERDEG
jgi:prevent-host-death family protein